MKPVIALLTAAMVAGGGARLNGQSFALLHNFTNNLDGANIYAGLTADGNTLYGVAEQGGAYGGGTVFAVAAEGSSFTVLHDFTNSSNPSLDGSFPYGGLVLAGDTLYGTTAGGGTNLPAGGIVFSVRTNGDNYTILHNFTVADGQFPHGRLILSGNTLYGTSLGAGSTGWGSVWSLTTDGSNFNVLHTCSAPVSNGTVLTNWDGEQPWAGMVLVSNTLYGTCYGGGTSGYGTVYSVQTDGKNFTVLHTFTNSPEGAWVQGGLTASGNILYGVTLRGGASGAGTIFLMKLDGGDYRVMHSFQTNGIEGIYPWGGMALAGNRLYGATQGGGANRKGTLYSMSTYGGIFTVLHAFNGADGDGPVSDLILSRNTVFGTARLANAFSQELPAPYITSVTLAGTNLTLNATNGLMGQSCTVLMSTNVASPFSQWIPVATNRLIADGPFTITATNAVDAAARQRFFILQAQ